MTVLLQRLVARPRLARALLAVLGGTVAFLGFAGFDLWPLSFVAFAPLLLALRWPTPVHGAAALRTGWLFGFVGIWGGYYWIVQMLEDFSGFPTAANVGIAALLLGYLALQFALFAWLWDRAEQRGWHPVVAAVAVWCALEWLFPNLFPFFYGASLHPVPLLVQVVDLGGPGLLSALLVGTGAALYLAWTRWRQGDAHPLRPLTVMGLLLAATLVYGAVRIAQVDTAVAEAPKLTVGMVQANMGIFDKRLDPTEGQRRHIEQTLQLQRTVPDLDLVLWPESAITFFVPETRRNLRDTVTGPAIRVPVLFGGLARRRVDGRRRYFNTAYLLDAEGNVLGTYDKTYLLAFGEYLPFGETFPVLYEWSPHSGRFTPGDHVRPVRLGPWRLTVLICYEDILPAFARKAVREGHPHLLVNLTNDAWFGDTHEPWIHLALAKFRAVEHRRFLARSTNSGVSAFVDPAGRVVAHTGVFERANLHAEVAMLDGLPTLYGWIGDWFAMLCVLGMLVMATTRPGRWSRRRQVRRPPKAP